MASIDRRERKQHKRWYLEMSSSPGSSVVKFQELPAPHSYVKYGGMEVSERNQNVDKDLVVKRSWDVALGPSSRYR
ncbi:hypothetical protein EB796_022916 [Bugula neritina]|uniref:Uncharacterized protein n=1 Tax=Bugula neritina TaxID=10212 RepID=A0A7J7IZB8_BUGNE|nr:hypothetical protein EB796_022916 [Bugula neritina]